VPLVAHFAEARRGSRFPVGVESREGGGGPGRSPGESPDALTDTTPLITGGVLSSITTLQVVTFLEDEFGVEFVAREIDLDNMDTVEGIASLVESKLE